MSNPEYHANPELSPGDALVQRAAVAYFNSRFEFMAPEERLYQQAAFLTISHLFAPIEGEPHPVTRAVKWRDYAAQQFREATGIKLGLATQNSKVWRNIGREIAIRFKSLNGFQPADELELAEAILDHSPHISFNARDIGPILYGDVPNKL